MTDYCELYLRAVDVVDRLETENASLKAQLAEVDQIIGSLPLNAVARQNERIKALEEEIKELKLELKEARDDYWQLVEV